jgi:hypothetical protein
MTHPHIEKAEELLAKAATQLFEGSMEWQEALVTLLTANTEATLAVAIELRALRQGGMRS